MSASACAALRRYPRHAALGALVAGLLLAPSAAAVAGAAGAATAATGIASRRIAVALACGGLLLGGAWLGTERRRGIDASRLGPLIERAVDARGYVVRRERARGRERRIRLRLREVSAGDRGAIAVNEIVELRAVAPLPPIAIGDEVRAHGVLEQLPGRPDDRFDYAAYLRRAGVHAVMRAEHVAATGARRGCLSGFVDGVRRRAEIGVAAGLDPQLGALARGIVLGQDESISRRVSQEFKDSGLAHLLAVSGQNVTLLAILAMPLLAAAGLGRRARLVGVLALIALYVPLAGAGPSVMRAGAMGVAATVAMLAGRASSRWYAVLLAMAFTLALDPRACQDVGWQLSFAAVGGILYAGPRLRARLDFLPASLAEAGAVTVAATLATAPLMAFHFERVSLVALLANLIAFPAVAPIMWLGTLAAATAQVAIAPAALLNAANGFCLAFLTAVAGWCARLPGAVATVKLGSPAVLVAAYAVPAIAIAALRRLRPRLALESGGRRLAAAATLAAVLALAALSMRGSPDAAWPERFSVTFLDVGQGDAVLLQAPDGAGALIDGGPPGNGIVSRLRALGVRALSVVVLTHAQADHEGGLVQVVRELPVGLLLDGGHGSPDPLHREIVRSARERGIRLATPRAGDAVSLGPLRLRVLGPDSRGANTSQDDPNDRAVVLVASYRRIDVLLPADAESDVTLGMSLPRAEVLKVAHHGSRDEGLSALLGQVRPQIAVIEVGGDNGYGHPHASTLAALRAVVPRVLRTDRDGEVRVALAGDRLEIHTRD